MSVDVLTDVFETVSLRSVLYARLELTSPWGVRLDPTPGPSFHVVGRGSCSFDVDGVEEPILVSAGDYILLTKGQGHAARDARSTPALPLRQILSRLQTDDQGVTRYGGGGSATSMVCGSVTFDDQLGQPLLATLPPWIHVANESRVMTEWLGATLQMFGSEVVLPRPGSQAILKHLADVLFIQAIRSYAFGSTLPESGWLRGLSDPQIAAALGHLHAHPERAWRVEQLAAQAGMSRSAFFARFSELVGEPPLKYLATWRMRKAQQMIHDGRATIKEVGVRVGYASEAAFSRAFKRWVGVPPIMYRTVAVETPSAPPPGAVPSRRPAI
jgi:AraC-like DNA-binding protein